MLCHPYACCRSPITVSTASTDVLCACDPAGRASVSAVQMVCAADVAGELSWLVKLTDAEQLPLHTAHCVIVVQAELQRPEHAGEALRFHPHR